MTNKTITHLGIVESIQGSHLQVRIVQTSACAACSAKGHCTSADSQEKLIDVTDTTGATREIGDKVLIVGEMSMGMWAVMLAFVVPFLLLVTSLFILMAWLEDDLVAPLLSLALLVPYYFVLWLNRSRMKRTFSFTVR